MRKRITPATILAMIALFVALAGTATAGTALITGAQIKNGSIGLADMSPKAKAALKGARGPQGPAGRMGPMGAAGLAGAQGVQGPAGGFDPNKITYVEGATITIAPQDAQSALVACPAGAKAISGGWVVISGGSEVFGSKSYNSGVSWSVLVWNDSEFTDATVTPFAVCAAS